MIFQNYAKINEFSKFGKNDDVSKLYKNWWQLKLIIFLILAKLTILASPAMQEIGKRNNI